MLGSCTKRYPEQETISGPAKVSFDAYVNRGVTRAGSAGILDVETLKTAGFGVFAYNTGVDRYTSTSLPDFMYNMLVANSGSAWDYSPVRYWPNGEDGLPGRLSFFAYAPHVGIDPSGIVSGDTESGMVSFKKASETGDPSVVFKASLSPASCVDLCWADPVIDAEKPATDSKVLFNFRHALASLNVQVDAVVDETASPGSIGLDPDTRIYVRSVSFGGFADKGTLDLGSVGTPHWTGYIPGTPLQKEALVVHDGRLDGWEARYGDTMESPTGLNPVIVQQDGFNAKSGVTPTIVNVFNSDLVAEPVFVIPNNYPLAVNIVYDVETRDDKLDTFLSDGITHGSKTRVNVRTAVVTATDGPVRMESGKKYILRLHLGLTSVKFQAEIGISDHWSEDPHPIEFEPVIIGQDIGNYDVDNAYWTEWN